MLKNSNKIKLALHSLHRFENIVLALVLAAMILLASAQIFLRNTTGDSLTWADPLLRLLVLWVGLIGAMVASRENKHISIDVLTHILSEKAKYISRAITNLFTSFITAVIGYHAFNFVIIEYQAGTELFFGFPAWPGETIIPFAFCSISLRYFFLFLLQLQSIFIYKSTP